MSISNIDVVVRGGIMDGLSPSEKYEVRLGPCPWVGPYDLTWRVSSPVTLSRAIELAEILLRSIAEGGAFAMPPEFNIVGRLEPVLPAKKISLNTIDCQSGETK